MLETRAVVVQTSGCLALVRPDMEKGCSHCSGKGCGAGRLSGLICTSPRQFEAENPINAVVGDQVVVAVAEGAVLRASVLIYGLPLLFLVAGVLLGNVLAKPAAGDALAALGAAVGAISGFVLAKWISSGIGNRHARPHIVRHWNENEAASAAVDVST